MKTPAVPTPLKYVLYAAIALPVLLRLLAPLPGIDRLWGFDMLRDLSPYTGTVLTLLPLFALLVFVPGIQRPVVKLSEQHGRAAAAVVLSLLLLATLLWPMDSFFYGDGGLLIPQVHLYSVDGGYDVDLLMNLKSAPLAGSLLIAAMHVLPSASSALGLGYPSTALYPFGVLSALSLLGLSLYILIALPRREQFPAALLAAGSAGSLLFFGYVEYYAPVHAAVVVFLLAGERLARGTGSIHAAIVAFAVAVASHYLALALLPLVVFLLALRYPTLPFAGTAARYPIRVAAISVAAFFLFYLAAGFWSSDSRIFMPGAEVESAAGTLRYTLFSQWHLADIVNLVLLLAPVAVFFLAAIPFMKKRSGHAGFTTSVQFGLLAVLFLAAFIFFANTSLGLARDWDIAAPLGTALLFTALLLLKQHSPVAVISVGTASVLMTLPWIAVNTNGAAVSERFERIIRLDEEHMYGDYALSGYEALRKFHRNQGSSIREIDLTQRMVEILDYPLHYRELLDAASAIHGNEADTYNALQRWMLTRLRGKAEALREQNVQRDYSIGMEQIDSLALGIGVQALTLRVPFPEDLLNSIAAITRGGRSWPGISGMQAYARGEYQTAAEMIEQELNSGFASPTLFLFSGNALALSGRHTASLARLEDGTARFPSDAMLRYTLGKYYARAGIRSDRARELLQWCLDRGVPTGRADEISAILLSLQARE